MMFTHPLLQSPFGFPHISFITFVTCYLVYHPWVFIFLDLVLGCTNLLLKVLNGLMCTWIPCLRITLATASVMDPTYGRLAFPLVFVFSVELLGGGLFCLVATAHADFVYPDMLKTSLRCWISLSLASLKEQMILLQWYRVLITPSLCWRGWLLVSVCGLPVNCEW